MFEAKSDSVGIDLHVKIGGETGRGGTDRTDKRGFCQFCRLPMMLFGAWCRGMVPSRLATATSAPVPAILILTFFLLFSCDEDSYPARICENQS